MPASVREETMPRRAHHLVSNVQGPELYLHELGEQDNIRPTVMGLVSSRVSIYLIVKQHFVILLHSSAVVCDNIFNC